MLLLAIVASKRPLPARATASIPMSKAMLVMLLLSASTTGAELPAVVRCQVDEPAAAGCVQVEGNVGAIG